MRDAGLSAKAWMDVNNNDYASVREVMEGYASCTVVYCTVVYCTVLQVRQLDRHRAAQGRPVLRRQDWSRQRNAAIFFNNLLSAKQTYIS